MHASLKAIPNMQSEKKFKLMQLVEYEKYKHNLNSNNNLGGVKSGAVGDLKGNLSSPEH